MKKISNFTVITFLASVSFYVDLWSSEKRQAVRKKASVSKSSLPVVQPQEQSQELNSLEHDRLNIKTGFVKAAYDFERFQMMAMLCGCVHMPASYYEGCVPLTFKQGLVEIDRFDWDKE